MTEGQVWCGGVRDLTEPHYAPASNFYWRNNKGRRRKDHICKECRKAHTKRWRKNNRDKVKKYDDAYREKNRDKIRDSQREFYRMVYGKGAWTWKKYRPEYGERVPTEPFRLWIDINVRPMLAPVEEVRELAGMGNGALDSAFTLTNIARHIEADPKTFPNYVTGKAKTIPRDMVDRVGLLFGHMALSDELYPEESDG